MSTDPSPCTRRSVLKGLAAGSAACVLGDLTAAGPASAAKGGGKLPRTNPEAVGIAPGGVVAFLDAVDQKLGGLHSFMLLRHGQVAAEGWWAPYAPQHPHMLYSLSKSFTSTAAGFAVDQGLLKIDALVTSFFPDDLPAQMDENLRAMRVRHLLTMSTGHDKDATGRTTNAKDGNWVKAFLSLPVEHEPGTHFVYNSAATYMLSAIVQKLTGMTVLEYLRPRLFGPLGIEGETWETCPRGINTGGWGLSVKTEDIARFGQTYLQRGKWQGQQVVPESWVAEATRKQISNGNNPDSDWAQGYGFQFWRCRHGAFRGDGAFGQFCVVMPEQDAVIAITSGLGDMQAVLTAAWDHLLPAMSGGSAEKEGELKRRLKALTVPPPPGQAASDTSKRVSGKTYQFEGNGDHVTSATPVFKEGECSVTMRRASGDYQIKCGRDGWSKSTAPLDGKDVPVAARGAWTDADTYTMKLCFYETPYIRTTTWKFNGDEVQVSSRMNVAFTSPDRGTLKGRATG